MVSFNTNNDNYVQNTSANFLNRAYNTTISNRIQRALISGVLKIPQLIVALFHHITSSIIRKFYGAEIVAGSAFIRGAFQTAQRLRSIRHLLNSNSRVVCTHVPVAEDKRGISKRGYEESVKETARQLSVIFNQDNQLRGLRFLINSAQDPSIKSSLEKFESNIQTYRSTGFGRIKNLSYKDSINLLSALTSFYMRQEGSNIRIFTSQSITEIIPELQQAINFLGISKSSLCESEKVQMDFTIGGKNTAKVDSKDAINLTSIEKAEEPKYRKIMEGILPDVISNIGNIRFKHKGNCILDLSNAKSNGKMKVVDLDSIDKEGLNTEENNEMFFPFQFEDADGAPKRIDRKIVGFHLKNEEKVQSDKSDIFEIPIKFENSSGEIKQSGLDKLLFINGELYQFTYVNKESLPESVMPYIETDTSLVSGGEKGSNIEKVGIYRPINPDNKKAIVKTKPRKYIDVGSDGKGTAVKKLPSEYVVFSERQLILAEKIKLPVSHDKNSLEQVSYHALKKVKSMDLKSSKKDIKKIKESIDKAINTFSKVVPGLKPLSTESAFDLFIEVPVDGKNEVCISLSNDQNILIDIFIDKDGNTTIEVPNNRSSAEKVTSDGLFTKYPNGAIVKKSSKDTTPLLGRMFMAGIQVASGLPVDASFKKGAITPKAQKSSNGGIALSNPDGSTQYPVTIIGDKNFVFNASPNGEMQMFDEVSSAETKTRKQYEYTTVDSKVKEEVKTISKSGQKFGIKYEIIDQEKVPIGIEVLSKDFSSDFKGVKDKESLMLIDGKRVSIEQGFAINSVAKYLSSELTEEDIESHGWGDLALSIEDKYSDKNDPKINEKIKLISEKYVGLSKYIFLSKVSKTLSGFPVLPETKIKYSVVGGDGDIAETKNISFVDLLRIDVAGKLSKFFSDPEDSSNKLNIVIDSTKRDISALNESIDGLLESLSALDIEIDLLERNIEIINSGNNKDRVHQLIEDIKALNKRKEDIIMAGEKITAKKERKLDMLAHLNQMKASLEVCKKTENLSSEKMRDRVAKEFVEDTRRSDMDIVFSAAALSQIGIEPLH